MRGRRSAFRRIRELDRAIRSGHLTTAAAFAKQHEISKRTVEEDLALLRDMGAEVQFNRSKKRYEYIGDPVILPAQWISSDDIATIMIAERALSYFTGFSSQRRIHQAFNKFLDPVRYDTDLMHAIQDKCNGVVFRNPVQPIYNVYPRFEKIFEAVLSRKRISMYYDTGGQKAKSRRELEPYVLLNDGGDWYVIGHCLNRREIHRFSLDRMKKIITKDFFFSIPENFSVKKYVSAGFGRMSGSGEPINIRLHISPPASAWIGRNNWHHSQKIQHCDDGSIILELHCPLSQNLTGWILNMGRNVKVLSPQKLKNIVTEEAKAILKMYP